MERLYTEEKKVNDSNEKNFSTMCPECGKEMYYTGLPDIAGEVQFRFYKCPDHGIFKVYEKSSSDRE